jgi:hypothetical protein
MAELIRNKMPKLGEILFGNGVITKKQLALALNYQYFEKMQNENASCRVGEFFLNHGIISNDQLTDALKKQEISLSVSRKSFDFKAKFKSFKNNELFTHFPAILAKKYNVFPIAMKEELLKKTLFIATENPNDISMVEELQFQLGFFVHPIKSTRENIRKYINKYY